MEKYFCCLHSRILTVITSNGVDFVEVVVVANFFLIPFYFQAVQIL
jgi:hypothetical protein